MGFDLTWVFVRESTGFDVAALHGCVCLVIARATTGQT